MPSKSRRSRRTFPRSRGPVVSPEVAAPAERNIVSPRETLSRPGRAGVQAEAVPVYPYILSELKWIALVTVVIAAILVVLYVVFR